MTHLIHQIYIIHLTHQIHLIICRTPLLNGMSVGFLSLKWETRRQIISFQMQRKVFSCLLLSRRFHLQKSDLFGPRTIKHSGRGAKRNWCNFLLFYSKMHLGAEIKDKVVVQRTCFSKVGFRLPPLPPLEWRKENVAKVELQIFTKCPFKKCKFYFICVSKI